jgi:hypothetical protein
MLNPHWPAIFARLKPKLKNLDVHTADLSQHDIRELQRMSAELKLEQEKMALRIALMRHRMF